MNKNAKANNSSGVRTGTLTLLLLVVAIVLAVLAVLTLQTARSNEARSDAFASNVEQFYLNDAAAQEACASLDALLSTTGSKPLTVGDVKNVLPEGFEVTSNSVRGAFVNGKAQPYDSIITSSKTYETGIADDGMSTEDADSTPALLIELKISTDGYTVHSWQHVRSYSEEGSQGSSPHLFNPDESNSDDTQ